VPRPGVWKCELHPANMLVQTRASHFSQREDNGCSHGMRSTHIGSWALRPGVRPKDKLPKKHREGSATNANHNPGATFTSALRESSISHQPNHRPTPVTGLHHRQNGSAPAAPGKPNPNSASLLWPRSWPSLTGPLRKCCSLAARKTAHRDPLECTVLITYG
jgi:hypothetical protein